MKRLVNQSMIALASVLVAGMMVACDAKNAPSVLPDFGGEIKFDRAQIGEDQKVTATYVMPTGSRYIEWRQMYWYCDDHKILKNSEEKDGASILNFTADYAVGKHKIEFVRHYLDLKSGEAGSKSKVGELTIVACDVLTSFWTDSKATVLATANEKFEDPNADVLEAYVRNPVSGASIDELHQYYFTGDKLTKVLRTILYGAHVGKAVVVTNARTLALEKKGYKRLSFDIVEIATGEKSAVDMTKINDPSYTIPISTDVENGRLELLSTLQSDKTKVTLSYKLNVGLLLNLLTYTPR